MTSSAQRKKMETRCCGHKQNFKVWIVDTRRCTRNGFGRNLEPKPLMSNSNELDRQKRLTQERERLGRWLVDPELHHRLMTHRRSGICGSTRSQPRFFSFTLTSGGCNNSKERRRGNHVALPLKLHRKEGNWPKS
jgi:hypothetical protein